MIDFDTAFQKVMAHALVCDEEQVSLASSLNRVLARDVASDTDMPPFNKSAMDGYACRLEDLKNPLQVKECIPAGSMPTQAIGKNECSKIMTGSMVPEGADCVVMIEHTEELADGSIRFIREKTKTNICIKAEDIQAGDVVLRKGTLIRPQHIAVLASVGCAEPWVMKKPRVGIIATGSELVNPSEPVTGAKIRNSNGWQLAAQAELMGAAVNQYGIAIDTEEAIDTAVKKAMTENDLIILSGGVSVGDFDLVPGALKKNGLNILFDEVSIQPGRPSTFAVADKVLCFGLPGNPVSTFTQFEMLIKPLLYQMMGHIYKPSIVSAVTESDLKRRRTDRMAITPVQFISPGKVDRIDYHGSAHIHAMCQTDGFILFPLGETLIEKGTVVDVRLLQ